MPVKPFSGTFGKTELIHLLKRTLFGAKRIDLTIYSGKTLSEVVNNLLGSEMSGSTPVNNYNDSSLSDPNVPDGQTWISAPYGNGTLNSRRLGSFTSWWTGMMIEQAPTLREKMVLFWHNHFATETATVGDARYSYKTNALFRTFCHGNFRDLVKQVTLD